MKKSEELIKLDNATLKKILVDWHNDSVIPKKVWVKDVVVYDYDYNEVDNIITLEYELITTHERRYSLEIDIELQKDLSEGFGEENNVYDLTIYYLRGLGDEEGQHLRAELQEDFKEFMKKK